MSPLRQLLIEEEGVVPHVYPDHLGFLTIGVGHLVDERKGGKLPHTIIESLLDYDIAAVYQQAQTIPGFNRLNEIQRAVVCSMVFQMGMEPFDGDGFKDFKNFLASLAAGDLSAAAAHGLDSKWAREDTPARAKRQMQMLMSGQWVRK
jgi:GH24 family phage-related lysozyme (muramidase)